MTTKRPLLCLVALTTVFAFSGASCHQWRRPLGEPGPQVFRQPPTATEIVEAVNANSNAIQQLQAQGATISVQGLPALKTNLVIQRPRSLRLQANVLGLGGSELDIGSNDELFWVWIKQAWATTGMPKGVFYARHEEFNRGAARSMIPIEPEWLIEALGVVTVQPSAEVRGPIERGPGRYEIEMPMRTSSGEYTRVLIVDDRYAWVLEQHVKDSTGRVIASARAGRHRYYPEHGVSLPEQVSIHLAPGQPNQIAMDVYVGRYAINQLGGDRVALFQMPQIEGYPQIDLADPRFRPTAPARFAPPDARTGYRPPRLRGARR